MAKILIIGMTFFLYFSCSESKDNEQQEIKFEFPAKKNTLEIDNQPNIKTSSEESFFPDTSVSGLKLVNSNSIIESIGSIEGKIEESESLPCAYFSNAKGDECLTLTIFPGSGYNDVYKFTVSFANIESEVSPLSFSHFETESGIRLGISKEELIEIKGGEYTELKSVIRYEITNYRKSEFLKRYNMPIYYSTYDFDNENNLKEFEFGFEYP